MSSHAISLYAATVGLSKRQIQQAGQRYTPGIEPGAPNLRIEALSIALDNVACGAAAQARFDRVLEHFSEEWKRAKSSSLRAADIDPLMAAATAFVPAMMTRMLLRDATAGDEWSAHLSGIKALLLEDSAYWRTEEEKLGADDGSYSSSRIAIRSHIQSISACLSVVRDEIDYAASSSFKLLFAPNLLIGGEWGTGKTHLLCDVTTERLGRSAPTVLVLAKNFQGDVMADIGDQLAAGISIEDQFAWLNEAGATAAERALVLVDGVNEGRRREWRQAITALLSLTDKNPNVGLVVSCRTPFEAIAIHKTDLPRFLRLQHYGFDDQEFDAQTAFFQHYRLPLPEVPLLDREFSRPLTLKLICQSLQKLTDSKVSKGFAGIASGQRGMTFVLESFVNRIGATVEMEFGLKSKGCWFLLKGEDHLVDQRIAGFAPCMATSLRGYVLPTEADNIVAASYPTMPPARRRKLLEALRTNGLIEEDAVWYSTNSGAYKSRIVYRLPYQRFSDHLIARHLLKAYLDSTSADTIKRSFAGNSPLGRVFRLSRTHHRQYEEPGWAQALITEFAERAGNLPPKERELFFALPNSAQDWEAYFEPFIEGLFWRNPKAFTAGTLVVLNKYLGSNGGTWERVVDALAAISTKPSHPFHASRLYKYLAQYSMADRDLRWSEYLRRKYTSPTIHRLLTWAEKLEVASMSRASAVELVALFSLVLTTVVRRDRDLATKALVMIGERFPDVLFAHVLVTLDFNDPYVPERMLAAAYGATLSLVDSERVPGFKTHLGALALELYRRMFAPRANRATHHTLMRDYALGIIEVAQHTACAKLPRTSARHLSRPFARTPSPFTSTGKPDALVTEAIGHAIQMDFGNYTIGRLIPDRANYNHEHPEYVSVRAKIERRMFDLGYRAELFKHVEHDLGRNSWNSRNEHKVDRYGKKYSWIAYFEMWGERDAQRKLPDWRQGERTPDCGVDPTFPRRPPVWSAPIPDLFGEPTTSTEEWVAGGYTPNWKGLLVVPEINGITGDWVLVEGYVRGADELQDRELFAFLRGLFVSRNDVDALRDKFHTTHHSGSDRIPEPASEHYVFGGEPGHRSNYARHLRLPSGRYKRQTQRAFDEYVEDPGPPRRRSLTLKFASMLMREVPPEKDVLYELETPVRRLVPGIRVELPSIRFAWESHHSPHNAFSGFSLPAPSLIQRLDLRCRDREIDFFDANTEPATLYREAGDGWKGNRYELLYVRADLLRRYLSETRQVLVWCNWGERDWRDKIDGFSVRANPARERVYQDRSHVHRSFAQWSPNDSTIV
ncbi:hypothetical protein [Inhella crocodyli]|uniref:ATP-binding protein n=1 Tax=Inhella crocodyli TaxID=2499851 RepID=A0A3S2XM88_9BURK|nr:hypothetical protein [Inhella crocodyli]RVT82451.1 hypothetical protein EOD73_17105 [Inhella crocodyli]